MAVTDRHPQFEKFVSIWTRVQDCLDGEDAVKARDEATGNENNPCPVYLPKVNSKQSPAGYRAYKLRAKFVNFVSRTRAAMAGMIFRKEAIIKTPGLERNFTEDCDLRGSTIAGYARKVTNAVCGLGRGGTLVDYNETEKRPYLSYYEALDITNWKTGRVNGRPALVLLVLREWVQEDGADEYAPASSQQWLVYRLKEAGAGKTRVTVERWKSKPKDPAGASLDKAQPGDPGTEIATAEKDVTRRMEPLDAIPFVFHNCEEPGPDINVPPLNDISVINIHHYQGSADRKNALNKCATPTPWASGFPASDKVFLGAEFAWWSEQQGATAGMVEPSGNGLAEMREEAAAEESQMAALGARLIEPPKKDAEAYATVQIKAGAETSTLARIGLLTSEGLSEVLQWCAWWQGTAKSREELKDRDYIELNKEFVSTRLTPEELAGLIQAYLQGAMSWEEFWWNMNRGEMYQEGSTPEKELAKIKANPPMPAVSGLDADGNPVLGKPPEPPPEDNPPPAK